MRGLLVLAGMAVAAGAAVLIWLDATDQLRPWLSTSPQIVFQLDPAPVAAEPDPVGSATIATAPEPETSADTDVPIDPASGEVGTAGEIADGDTVATVIADDDLEATLPETELAADFGEGAIALSDVPIATVDSGASADGEIGRDGEPIAEPATTATEIAPAVADNDADVGTAEAGDANDDASAEAGAEADTPEVPPVETADTAEAIVVAGETAEPATTDGADPDTVQTAALPILPTDPNLPWRLYAAPFADGEPRPRIAIVFVSLGLSDGATEAIIQQMPGPVTLAFSPYSRKLPDWISRARAKGHEVLVELPMEPLNYPDDDPGPLALLDDRPIEDNVTRLDGILDRAEGAVGVAAQMGSRFTGDEALIGPILEALGERGFLYVDNSTAPASVIPTLSQRIAVPIVINDHYLDIDASRIAIDGRLQQIERIARSEGAAVAFAMPYPITIERLLAWIPTLEAKGFVLAPVTSVVGHQELP